MLCVPAVSPDRLVLCSKSVEEVPVPVPYQVRAEGVGFGPKPRVLVQVLVGVIAMNGVLGIRSGRMIVTEYVDRLPTSMSVLSQYI
jgi:hypothetical protein